MDKIKPSRWYYALAALIIVAGSAIFFSYLFSSLEDINKGLTQIVVPGDGDVILQAGKHTIFNENESIVGSRIYSTGRDISGLQIELKNKSTGIIIPLYVPEASSTYSIGGRSGRSVLDFAVDQQGTYKLSGWYPNGDGPDVVLAVGKDPFESIILTISVGIAVIIGSIMIAAAIIATVYQRRRKDEQRLKYEAEAMRGRRLY